MRLLCVEHKEIFGGGQVALLNTLRAWQAQRVAIEPLIVSAPRAAILEHARANQIPCAALELGAIEKTRGIAWNMRQRMAPTARLFRLMRAFQPDALLANGAYSFLACAFAAKLARVPVVWYEQNTNLPHDRTLRWLIAQADAIAVVTQIIRAQFIQLEPRARAKTTVVYNGMFPENFSANAGAAHSIKQEIGWSQDARVIGTVSRLSPEKNVGLYLQAAQKTSTAIPNARFLIVGDGPERAALETRAAELGLQELVYFAGQRTDVPHLLQAMDVFVLSSDTEGFSLAVVEAMAAARAIVATDVGGVREALNDGESGIVIPPRDAKALTNAVLVLLRDETKQRALGERARARALGKFTVTQQAAQLQKIVESVVRG